ncbi:unnamed protein product [Prunus armeniaca]
MSSPKTRAQGSSSSVPPDYITGAGVDNHTIEVRSKLHPFAQKNLDENVLHLFKNTMVLGPHWFGPVPTEMAKLMKKDAEAPLCFESTSALASHSWVSKNMSRSFPSSEVRNSSMKWHSINRDENLLAAALCFCNSASNTFDFRVGPMAPTLLDMAKFSAEKDKDQQHMLFLLYWLNRFILPNRSSAVLLEYKHLVEALHNHTDVRLGPTVLAHLFKNLHTATLENPLSLSAPGAFWMIQIWLQVYFTELRFPDIILLEDQVMAAPLMSVEVPKQSIKEYLMFFRHCTKRSAAQWQVKSTIPTSVQGNLAALSSFHLNLKEVAIGALLGEMQMTWRCTRMLDWKVRFHDLPASSTALEVLFKGWDGWTVHTGEETHKFMVQTIKDINAQVIEDPSLTQNIGGQSVQAREVIVTSVIATGDLELPSGEGEEEEEEDRAEQTAVEATPSSARRKRKETAQPAASVGSPSPPPTKSKQLRKRTIEEYVAAEATAAVPTTTSGTDEELREAFEAVEQEKELEALEEVGERPQEETKTVEEEEEIPAEVIVESIALAQKQQEKTRFEDPEAEHSTTAPAAEEQVGQSASEPVEQAKVPVLVPEAVVEMAAAAPEVVMPIHSLPRAGSELRRGYQCGTCQRNSDAKVSN